MTPGITQTEVQEEFSVLYSWAIDTHVSIATHISMVSNISGLACLVDLDACNAAKTPLLHSKRSIRCWRARISNIVANSYD